LGLIQILDQEKDEIINKLESDLKTLETKNLELKYANRNLISTLSEQKNMLKALKSKISTLESSNMNIVENNFEKLNKEHIKLLDKYNKLQQEYKLSQDEIRELKNLIPESKSTQSILGRFLKRNVDKEDNDVDHATETQQKFNSEKKG
jgi:hypothetical protein